MRKEAYAAVSKGDGTAWNGLRNGRYKVMGGSHQGTICYIEDRRLSNLKGPAVINPDGTMELWIKGIKFTTADYTTAKTSELARLAALAAKNNYVSP